MGTMPAAHRRSLGRCKYGDRVKLEAGPCLLRPWQLGDRNELVEAANDYEVWRNLAAGFSHPYTVEDADGWISHCISEGEPSRNLAIEVGGQAVGAIGLELPGNERRRTGYVGYWLARRLWNQGIATAALGRFTQYAFETFDLQRLQASVFAWNAASVRVLEKCDYLLEGRLRRAIIKDGKVTDELVYGLLRPER
jgi:[ribosomal protein S5]-alanine N-acetyltransferase